MHKDPRGGGPFATVAAEGLKIQSQARSFMLSMMATSGNLANTDDIWQPRRLEESRCKPGRAVFSRLPGAPLDGGKIPV